MNALGIALVWCVVQVTLLGLLSGGLYLIVRKLQPAAAAAVALTGLVTVMLLSALALTSWPRWPLMGVGSQANAERSEGTDPSTPMTPQGMLGSPDGRSRATPSDAGSEASGEWLTRAALWWRTVLGQLSPGRPIAPDTAWRWPAFVAALLLAGMGAGTGWLLLGLLAVRSQRGRSLPVEDAALLELVDTLRAELGCLRRIEVRQASQLSTAATIGWRRPVILLPSQWIAWTAEQRRAVLAHEIAHVVRNDFLGVLCAQLGLVLHFYHPLLHWLMGRLRLEQELAADAAAAGVTGGQRQYLVTIAELALCQPDRALAWPARSFLPTQTTFLRRIAMLRDAKLRCDRLSPMARVLSIGAVLVCGLLAAGVRGPRSVAFTLADDVKAAGPRAPDVPDEIDTTFFTDFAAAIIVMRPAAVFARPELAGMGRLLEESAYVVPRGTRLADFRQITMIVPGTEDPRSGPREMAAFQSVSPLASTSLLKQAGLGVTVKEYRGKKIYVDSSHGGVVLQYDDHTLMTFGSESAMKFYFATKRGVLPKWLPPKAWEAFARDHIAVAADAAPMRKEMAMVTEHSPPVVRTAMSAFSSLWQDSAWLAAGARLDGKAAIHAWLEGRDAETATRLLRTADVVKMLAQNALSATRKPLESTRHADAAWIIPLADLGERLLADAKVQQEGRSVRVLGSAEVNAAALKAIGGSAVGKAADRARSMKNLKQIALAMHMYHDNYKCFPPAVLYGPDGKTPYSWRVALLPFLEQAALYREYRFDEPWDGPNNRRLAETRVPVFQCPSETARSANTSYFALVGPGTVFENRRGRKAADTAGSGAGGMPGSPAAGGTPGRRNREVITFADITDGTANTLMVVEAKRDIPWSKPEDIPYDPKKPIPELGGYFEGGFYVALCDGSVHFLPGSIAEATLRAMITRNGREVIDWRKEVGKR